ncbi:hypothetical protein Syun_007015 [Stephania yunnanensis]|uniref:Uncharacterized protein n=1 Tax=Stephania yunnanensis TaxID=152371 RepID=A0AAP0PZW7_9MAGN
MHKLKNNHHVRPNFVTNEAWRRYLSTREIKEFLARSKQMSMQRNTEVEGPETGPSKHDGSSISFSDYQ